MDAISMMTSMFFTDRDRIIFEVAINPVEQVGWMFCVCKKRDINNMRKTYKDIDFFGKTYEPSIFKKDRLALMSESQELFIDMFLNKVLNLFHPLLGTI
jgi:hypothetical protein